MATTPESILSGLLKNYVTYFGQAGDYATIHGLTKEEAEFHGKCNSENSEHRTWYQGLICKYANLRSGLPEGYEKNKKEILEVVNSTWTNNRAESLAKIETINQRHLADLKRTAEGPLIFTSLDSSSSSTLSSGASKKVTLKPD